MVALGAAAPESSAKTSCQNTFIPVIGGSAEWLDPSRWTQGHVPLSSEAVCLLGPGFFVADLTGEGHAATVTMSSNETAALDIASGAPCGDVSLTALDGVTIGKHGAVALASCTSQGGPHGALLDVGSSTIAVGTRGELHVVAEPAAASTVVGNVAVNGGLFSTQGNADLVQIEGNLTLGSSAVFNPALNSSPAVALDVTGTAALSGTVFPALQGSAQVGDTFTVLTAGAVTGQFTGEGGHPFLHQSAEYFRLTYTQTEVDATVTVAKLHTPASAQVGGDMVVTGTGFPDGDTVDLTLRDAAHAKFSLGSTTADGSGAFTDQVTVPGSAAPGKAVVTAQSTFDTSLKATSKLVLTG